MKDVKAIVVDLDRTLLRSDKTISEYTVEILKRCKSNSIKIMIATARPMRDTIKFYESVGFDAMTVSNGARIICTERKIEYGISKESADGVLRALENCPDLRITLETGDRAYSNKPIEDYETTVSGDLGKIAEEEGVLKLLVHMDNDNVLPTVEKALTSDLYYTVAHGYMIQIMNKCATKWNGVRTMLEMHRCPLGKTVYFGDDCDDIEPIKMCGAGVAVSNAVDCVKNVADHITRSNDEDGVARFIEENFLYK